MYNTTYANGNRFSQANSYLIKEILDATPQVLLLKIYDFAILNCQKKNMLKTNNALQELINSLKFDENDPAVTEISTGLLRLYQFCQDQMRKQNYDIVYKILSELRLTWAKAFNAE